MTEIHPIQGSKVSDKEFAQFVADLKVLLEAIHQELVAKWLKMDAGNFSKKVRGEKKHPITPPFLVSFYSVLSAAIGKLRAGVLPYQVILEMEKVEDPETYKNSHEEIRLLKERADNQDKKISELDAAIRELRAGL